MTDLIVVPQPNQWQKLKALVLDSVSSPITKRVYKPWIGRVLRRHRSSRRSSHRREVVPGRRWRTGADPTAPGPRVGPDHRAVPGHKAGPRPCAQRWDQAEGGGAALGPGRIALTARQSALNAGRRRAACPQVKDSSWPMPESATPSRPEAPCCAVWLRAGWFGPPAASGAPPRAVPPDH